MKSLGSLGEMAAEFAKQAARTGALLAETAEVIGVKIEQTAKREFGTYQGAAGPFPAWAPLSEATLYGWGPWPGKIDLGFAPPDNPLVRTHELQESISHSIEGLTVLIGSPDDKMVFHEFGTAEMPMRPVLGPAAFNNKAWIQMVAGAAAATAVGAGVFAGGRIHAALGYNFKVG